MAEGQVATKRVRKADTKLKGSGIKFAGQHFVCSYCANTSPVALVPSEAIARVAFDTLPCANAWVANNAPADKIATLHAQLATMYGQPPGVAICAPSTAALLQFGGNQPFDTWLPDADLWGNHAVLYGVKHDGIAKKAKKAKATAAAANVVFEVGMYMIYNSKSAPRKVDAIDGVPDKPKGALTAADVQRKLAKFATAHKEQVYAVQHEDKPQFSVTYLAPSGGPVDESHINNIATQLVGRKVYGPAMALFTRKTTLAV